MTKHLPRLTRRTALTGLGSAGLFEACRPGFAQTTLPPLSIVINASPWFDGFKNLVDRYEKETGNKVDLDVNPFGGSLEKQRSSVRASKGLYDVLIMNSGWFAEMYFGGFCEAVTDIDPSFKLDPGIYTCDDTCFFDPAAKTMTPAGKLYSMPVNPNIPLLFYRGDLYKQRGLSVPTTFDQLKSNAVALHKPPSIYGIAQRGARGPASVSYDFYPYLYGFGGGLFRDQKAGDFTVLLGNDKGRAALSYYMDLFRTAGHPKAASFDQAEVLQAVATGKAAHAIAVIAAWPQLDDPNKSAVVDKMELAPPPSAPGYPTAPGLGHWLAGISKNVPDDHKRAAVAFFRWFQTAEAQITYAQVGGTPVHKAAYEHPMSKERKNRWMKPMAEALPHAIIQYRFPESAEVVAILELGLNQVVAGEAQVEASLDKMTGQIVKLMESKGYRTGRA